MKDSCLLGVCLTALTVAPVHAQSADAPEQADNVVGIQEIVVTAEKRTATAQRTAAAITVVEPGQLAQQHITDATGLTNVLPSTQIYQIANNVQIAIRGLGSSFIDPRADPMVAVSMNGLFLDRTLPGAFALLDVSRIEALNGPQGTLYGRNAAAGAINIITNEPSQELEGNVSATVGNFDTRNATAVLNVPIVDTLAVRLAYQRDRSDGYLAGLDPASGNFKDFFNDVETDYARLSALWKPSDAFSVYAQWDHAEQGGIGTTTQPSPCPGSTQNVLNIIATCSLGGQPYQVPNVGFQDSETDASQLRIVYDFGPATLTSISGYVDTHTHYAGQNGSIFASPNPALSGSEQENSSYDFSQELRVSGNDNANHAGGLAWVVGGFYFDSTGNYALNVPSLGGGTVYPELPQRSKAGFGQATYGVTDRLRLTAGVRYTDDYKGLRFQFPGQSTFTAVNNNNVGYKGGVEFQLAPVNMIYASVASGYISGGSNPGLPAANPPPFFGQLTFQPEKLTTYEIGSKNRFFGNTVQLNAAAYYNDFENYQLFLPALVVGAPGPQTVIQNVPQVESYGLEVSAVVEPTDNDRFDVSMQLAHGEMGQANLVIFGFDSTGAFAGFPYTVTDGTRLLNLPEWQGTLAYSHRFGFANGTSLDVALASKISGDYLTVVPSSGQFAQSDLQGSYTRTDLSMTYTFKDDHLSLRGWVKNVEDDDVNVYGEGVGYFLYSVQPPRTYGLTVSARF